MPYDSTQPVERVMDSDAAYRRLAKQLHPDVGGGSTEAMQDLNLLMEGARKAKPSVEVDESCASESHADDDFEPLVIDNVALPRVASETIRSLSAEDRAKWEADRFKAKTDPLWLSGNVLGMDLIENPHRALFNLLPKMQPGLPLSKLSEQIKKFMILWPRGLGKTSVSRCYIIQLILNFPNIRVCFLTGGKPLAKLQLAAIKKYFESPTPEFRRLFPEYCLKSVKNKKTGEWEDRTFEMGTTEHFTVPANTSRVSVESTVCIITPHMVNSGAHFDVIFIDDLVHNDNYKSASALEKCYQDYVDVSPLLDPKGYIFMTGTRYASADTYGRIQETATQMGGMSVWKFSIRNCYSQGPCARCGHYEIFHDREVNVVEPPCAHASCECKGFMGTGIRDVLFPEVTKRNGEPFGHTLKFLDTERAEKGDKWFALQYMNDPQADGEQIFTEGLIGQQTLHHESQLPPFVGSTVYMCGDLAYSVSNERDESVIYVFTKYQGQLFVWGCIFGRWSANDRVMKILELLSRVRPQAMFLEKSLNWESLDAYIRMRAPEAGVYCIPILWTDLSNQKDAKNIRTADIEVALKSRRLWLYAAMPGYDRLVKQLMDFPNSKHDDFSDALAQVAAAPTGYLAEIVPQAQKPKNWLEGLHAAREVDDPYPDNGAGSGCNCG
jgi:hypothetical protein